MSVTAMLLRAALVFGLLAVTLWLIKRGSGGLKLSRRAQPLQVLGSAKLGKGATVAVVRIGDASYALGVTDRSVTLLTEAPMQPEEQPAAIEAAPATAPATAAVAVPAAVSAGKAFLIAFVTNLKNNAQLVAGRGGRRSTPVTLPPTKPAAAIEAPATMPAEMAAAVVQAAEAAQPLPAATFADLLAAAEEADELVLTLPDADATPAAVEVATIEETVELLLADFELPVQRDEEPVVEAFPAAQVAATAAALDARLARRIGARLGTLNTPALATAADGSAAYPAPRARARAPRRTDAVRRNEEHPWSTSCRMSGHVERFRRSPF